MLVLLDHFIRFSAFGMLIVAALVVFRRGRGMLQAQLISLASLVGAAYLLCSSATVRDEAGQFIVVLQAMCLAGPWAFWLASLSLFQDEFRLRPKHWVVLLIIELAGFAAIHVAGGIGPALLLHNLLAIGLFIHAVSVAWRGRSDDLIEARRRFRVFYVAGVAVLGIAISTGELLIAQSPAAPEMETAAAIGILTLTLLLVVYVLDIDSRKLFLPAPSAEPKPGLDTPKEPADDRLLRQIEKSMSEQHLYREAGLTISGLAAILNIPEHRLRAAINSGLGYRNFNAFVNAYRVNAVREALGDPAQRRTPVLTLALDAGFNSIAPFNRVFRAETGMTPTEYRDASARNENE